VLLGSARTHPAAAPEVHRLAHDRQELVLAAPAELLPPDGGVGRQALDQDLQAARAGVGELCREVEAVEALEIGLDEAPAES
jgi:hypothetical protein